MSDIAIRVRHISKKYKLFNKPFDRVKEALHPLRKKYHQDFFALKDISFAINKGTTVGIIGKNGSGKSTLLKIISNVLSPSEGEVSVFGKVSALLELGSGFNYELSGLENIYFSGAIMGYTKAEIDNQLDCILSFADIGDFINHPIKIYSSGMAVRLAFAIAVSINPEILIIDEALAVGDINFQMKCFKKFNDFRSRGKTILFISHSLDFILRYCDKAILLNGGDKIFEGQPKTTVDAYKRLLVKCNNYQMSATNPESISYGNNKAEIIEYGLFDNNDKPVQTLFHGEYFKVNMVVKFNADISNPILAYSIKDIKGIEILGTNTLLEQQHTGDYRKGDKISVSFSQKLNLQNGNFTLSLGCVNYENDELVAYHRVYDVITFESIALKKFNGMHDLDSKIILKKLLNDNDQSELL